MTNLFSNFYSQHTHTTSLRLNATNTAAAGPMSGGHATAPSLSLVLPLLWRLRHFATLVTCCAALLLNETRHDRCTILAGRSRACYSHAQACTSGEKFATSRTHTKHAGARAHVNTKRKESARSRLSLALSRSLHQPRCVPSSSPPPCLQWRPPPQSLLRWTNAGKLNFSRELRVQNRPMPTRNDHFRFRSRPTRHATRTQSRRKRANAFFTDRFFLCFRDNRAYTTIHRVSFVLNERVQCRKAQNTSRKSSMGEKKRKGDGTWWFAGRGNERASLGSGNTNERR